MNPPSDLIQMRQTKGQLITVPGRDRRVRLSVSYGWRSYNELPDGSKLAYWVTRPETKATGWNPDLIARASRIYPKLMQLAVYDGWYWEGPWYYLDNGRTLWRDYLIAAELRPDLGYTKETRYAKETGRYGLEYAKKAFDYFSNYVAYGRLSSDREDPIPFDASPEYVQDYLEARKGDLLEMFRHETTEMLLSGVYP